MDLSTGTPRILVVDDEWDLTDPLVTVVRAEGRRTEPAPDGTAAPRAARGFRPDAVVLDRGLPGLEGLELRLRRGHQRTGPHGVHRTAAAVPRVRR
ncbi:response regulator [Streptomyces sp. NPDC056683]|uniref:response regulator n=1 Tax=Streptomyces sp. NPDC056683 TaxID=3345910 RepID=UPI003688C5FD